MIYYIEYFSDIVIDYFHVCRKIEIFGRTILFQCDILDLRAIPMLKYRPVKKIDWASSGKNTVLELALARASS